MDNKIRATIRDELSGVLSLMNQITEKVTEVKEMVNNLSDDITGQPTICISDTELYTINANDVKWKLTNNCGGLSIDKMEGNHCWVKCECGTKYINEKETLTAVVDDKKHDIEIKIVSLI